VLITVLGGTRLNLRTKEMQMSDTYTDDDQPVEWECVDTREFVFEDGTTFVVEFVGPATIVPQITPDAESGGAHPVVGLRV
jgi:hypothetical protein